MDKPDSVMTPQEPLELHTDGKLELHKMTFTLVLYTTTLPFENNYFQVR